jgi:nucleotide-binding universal stress UspA family protein
MNTPRIVVGYDGSPAASAAINAGAALFPQARAWIVHLWTPPFANESLRRRLWPGTRNVDAFVDAIEREGEAEAERVAGLGVTLATAAGWTAEPLVRCAYGGEGLQFTQIAEKTDADLVLVGSRGLGGARAVLGSVSDLVVHYTPKPVLVVPRPMLQAEHQALAGGPVVVGWDGSPGAETALAETRRLFSDRDLIVTSVADGAYPTAGPPSPEGLTGRRFSHIRVEDGHGASARTVAEALSACACKHAAAAVVVGSRGRSAAAEILLGSTAMATLHHAHRAVMVVPTPAR